MEKVRLALWIIITGTLLGCQQNSVNTGADDNPVPVKEENFTFYTSKSMYDELQKNRSDNGGIPFEITDVWSIKEDDNLYLHVEVQHKKDCDDQFEVVWDGRVAESYPLQIYLVARLDAEHCRDLEEMTTDTLTLDVYKLISPEANPSVDDAVFRVSNASSGQDASSDEPVSDS